jgi:4-hydroxy-tetrahydrodipicolinate reductase
MAKIKIAVAGCLGRMGQELSKQIINDNKLEFVGGFEHKKHKDINKQFKTISVINSTKLVDSNPAKSIKLAKVLIDFTTPQSTLENVKIASQNETAVIIGTTGMTESQKKKVKNYAKKIPILMSSNMSLGVNLLFNLVQQTAHALKDIDYDIEIAETHHKYKKDAPSGTALSLGEHAAKGRKVSLNKSKVLDRTKKLSNRKKGDIGFSVTRGGEIAGEHTVSFIGKNDRVDLIHKANNRSIFVKGALDAAIFISKKKLGFYTMTDLLFAK